jgi:DNA repair exonuclease SbcCD ATPase subunit
VARTPEPPITPAYIELLKADLADLRAKLEERDRDFQTLSQLDQSHAQENERLRGDLRAAEADRDRYRESLDVIIGFTHSLARKKALRQIRSVARSALGLD